MNNNKDGINCNGIAHKPTLDTSKPIRTRDGRQARLVATLMGSSFPLLGVITNADGSEISDTFNLEGHSLQHHETDRDLVNVPEKVTLYINLYASGDTYAHLSRESAETKARRNIAAGDTLRAIAKEVTITLD